jgi:hypothetical protein
MCVALLASTLTFTGSQASAAPAAPKALFTAPNSGVYDNMTVLGDRLIGESILNSFRSSGKNSRLYFFDSKMKYREVVIDPNCVACISTSEPGLLFAGDKIFFAKATDKKRGIFSLDRKDKVKEYFFPVPKNNVCDPLTSFSDKIYVGCVDAELRNRLPIDSLFTISTDGSVKEVVLPTKALWELVYQGSNQLLWKNVTQTNPLTSSFYALDANGAFKKQFNVAGIYGDDVTIVAQVDNGWVLQSSTESHGISIQGIRGCREGLKYSQNFLMDTNGTFTTIGSLKDGESVVSDVSWFNNGILNFQRYIVNSDKRPIRQERYEVNQAGQTKKISSLNGPEFKSCRDAEWRAAGSYSLTQMNNVGIRYLINFDKFSRIAAAGKFCTSKSKGKAKGKIIFNGYAICLQGGKFMAYPYPEWEMPQLPKGDFPVINQPASNADRETSDVKLEPRKFQAAGVGDRKWPVKCPAFIDEPYRFGAPKIPGLYDGPQPKVFGFKFNGDATYTRLADGAYSPSKQADDLVGCYAQLSEFIPNSNGANFYHIGTINRTAMGYYWENADGNRLLLSLSGTTLTADKRNAVDDRGQRFILITEPETPEADQMIQTPEADQMIQTPTASQQIQPAGIGDASWTVKCPAVVDTVKTTQIKISGFKFDGTGQTFTRLADGTSTPSKQPENLTGCYANLYDFNADPKTTNAWQIGSINRDASGYYWMNAAGVRWGLTVSGSILITDKNSPYFDKGRQFITY